MTGKLVVVVTPAVVASFFFLLVEEDEVEIATDHEKRQCRNAVGARGARTAGEGPGAVKTACAIVPLYPNELTVM